MTAVVFTNTRGGENSMVVFFFFFVLVHNRNSFFLPTENGLPNAIVQCLPVCGGAC